MNLNPINSDNIFNLKGFFKQGFKETPADLNYMMLLCWADSLNLQYLIEDNILYVFAFFDGRSCLWIPPLGDKLSVNSIHRAFELISQIDKKNKTLDICYCWTDYPLWNDLTTQNYLRIHRQGSEYVYSSRDIALLLGRRYKTIRATKNRFIKNFSPVTFEYNLYYSSSCLELLELWKKNKEKNISDEYSYKLNLEYNACHNALSTGIPLEGVISFIDNKLIAFSLGYKHGSEIFSCMFEKTDPAYKDAPSYIFSELANYCAKSFDYITAGEDWNISYLAEAKKKWNPKIVNQTFRLSLQREYEVLLNPNITIYSLSN